MRLPRSSPSVQIERSGHVQQAKEMETTRLIRSAWRRAVSVILLLRSNDRTAVDLVGRYERDLRIGTSRSRQDLIFGNELVGSESLVEDDEDLVPQGVEALTLDGIDHREEVLLVVEVVRGVDRVDGGVVLEQRLRRRHLEHVDGDLFPLVEDGPLKRSAVWAPLRCERRATCEGNEQAPRDEDDS